jgi:hypothetical protein
MSKTTNLRYMRKGFDVSVAVCQHNLAGLSGIAAFR